MSKLSLPAIAAMSASLLLATTAAAWSGDLPYRSGAPYTVNQPLNAYSWAGPYLGGNIGYEWGSIGGNGAKPGGVAGGVQAGYLWQSGNIAYGLEGDIQISGAEDRFASYKFSNPWFGTLRGRVGYAVNNVLVYATGGLAFGELRAQTPFGSESHTNTGWTLGAGAEVGIYQNWTAKIEYLYVDLSGSRFTTTGQTNDYNFGMIRLGVNYHF